MTNSDKKYIESAYYQAAKNKIEEMNDESKNPFHSLYLHKTTLRIKI